MKTTEQSKIWEKNNEKLYTHIAFIHSTQTTYSRLSLAHTLTHTERHRHIHSHTWHRYKSIMFKVKIGLFHHTRHSKTSLYISSLSLSICVCSSIYRIMLLYMKCMNLYKTVFGFNHMFNMQCVCMVTYRNWRIIDYVFLLVFSSISILFVFIPFSSFPMSRIQSVCLFCCLF